MRIKDKRHKTIYKLTNLITGCYYIGCTFNLKERLNGLKHSNHNERLSTDLKKYPWENWKIEILEVVEQEGELAGWQREHYWIKELNATENGNYNRHKGCLIKHPPKYDKEIQEAIIELEKLYPEKELTQRLLIEYMKKKYPNRIQDHKQTQAQTGQLRAQTCL